MPDARAKRLRVYYALPRRYPWHSKADDNITRDGNEIGHGKIACGTMRQEYPFIK